MNRWMLGAGGALALGAVLCAFVTVYTDVGRSRGEEWGSLDGLEPVWPAALGFGSLWLMAIGAGLLALLVMIVLVRELLLTMRRR